MHACIYVCVCMLHINICPVRFVTALVGYFSPYSAFSLTPEMCTIASRRHFGEWHPLLKSLLVVTAEVRELVRINMQCNPPQQGVGIRWSSRSFQLKPVDDSLPTLPFFMLALWCFTSDWDTAAIRADSRMKIHHSAYLLFSCRAYYASRTWASLLPSLATEMSFERTIPKSPQHKYHDFSCFIKKKKTSKGHEKQGSKRQMEASLQLLERSQGAVPVCPNAPAPAGRRVHVNTSMDRCTFQRPCRPS